MCAREREIGEARERHFVYMIVLAGLLLEEHSLMSFPDVMYIICAYNTLMRGKFDPVDLEYSSLNWAEEGLIDCWLSDNCTDKCNAYTGIIRFQWVGWFGEARTGIERVRGSKGGGLGTVRLAAGFCHCWPPVCLRARWGLPLRSAWFRWVPSAPRITGRT